MSYVPLEQIIEHLLLSIEILHVEGGDLCRVLLVQGLRLLLVHAQDIHTIEVDMQKGILVLNILLC